MVSAAGFKVTAPPNIVVIVVGVLVNRPVVGIEVNVVGVLVNRPVVGIVVKEILVGVGTGSNTSMLEVGFVLVIVGTSSIVFFNVFVLLTRFCAVVSVGLSM